MPETVKSEIVVAATTPASDSLVASPPAVSTRSQREQRLTAHRDARTVARIAFADEPSSALHNARATCDASPLRASTSVNFPLDPRRHFHTVAALDEHLRAKHPEHDVVGLAASCRGLDKRVPCV